ncbi:hypothetical protein T484DRAFT_1758720, partial [Baffinella frigidus]
MINAVVQEEIRLLDLMDEKTIQQLILISEPMKHIIHKTVFDEDANTVKRVSDYDDDIELIDQLIQENIFVSLNVSGYIGFREPFKETLNSEICFAGKPGFMQTIPIKVVRVEHTLTEDNDVMTYRELNERCGWDECESDAFTTLQHAQIDFVRIGQGFKKAKSDRRLKQCIFQANVNNNMCLHLQNERIEKEVTRLHGYDVHFVNIPGKFDLFKFSTTSEWTKSEQKTYYDFDAIETFKSPVNTIRMCLLDVQQGASPVCQQEGTIPIFCDTTSPSLCKCITQGPIKILNLHHFSSTTDFL